MPLLDRFKQLFPGKRLNVSTRFALLHEAIQGTMSSFYMARDLRDQRIVGLKILDPKKTAAFKARFKGLHKPSEGEISMQLKHPSIVETLRVRPDDRGRTVPGDGVSRRATLHSALVARDPCLEGRRVQFIREAAEAIAAVHAAGFIHRDICPRNFMLTNNGEDLKLIDFGLTVPATQEFMQPGNRTGTPNYMAPELVRRRDDRPAARRVRLRRDGLRDLHVRAAVAARHDRHGRHDPRPTAHRHPQIPPANQSRPGQGDPRLHRASLEPALPVDGKIPADDPRSQTRRRVRRWRMLEGQLIVP